MVDFVRLLLFGNPSGSFQFLGSGYQRVKFTLVALVHVGGALREFSLEPSPHILLVLIVLGEKQPEGIVGTYAQSMMNLMKFKRNS